MAEAKVANRIASIFKTDRDRDTLAALCNTRNYIAHIGSFLVDQNELNLIRLYCERAMLFLYGNVNTFIDDETLDCYFRNIGKNDQEIDRLEKIISEIKKERKEAAKTKSKKLR